MTIRELRWLLELSRQKNFTSAANNLFITQSALSQCIQRVETELGLSLFQRDRKSVSVTPQGERFLDSARKIIAEYDNCLHEITTKDSFPFSRITIGAPPYICQFISRHISQFSSQFPQISLQLIDNNIQNCYRLFLEEKLDVICTTVPANSPEFYKTILCPYRAYIFLRKGSPAVVHSQDRGEKYPELDPKYLINEPFAFSSPGTRTRQIAEEILQQAGITPPSCQTIGRPSTLCYLAEQGVATSIYPLSKEIFHSFSDDSLIFQIPEHYSSSLGEQILLCRKRDLSRFPSGFYQALEQFIKHCVLDALRP